MFSTVHMDLMANLAATWVMFEHRFVSIELHLTPFKEYVWLYSLSKAFNISLSPMVTTITRLRFCKDYVALTQSYA